ncbi:MAG: serine/threonine-protein kinase RsbT [Tenuifilum sp.]|jgi:anti-sigma regulatory factor (Ser/Thr protein kinase)|uniref:ATP-binding protein n=1 Tax=Tenuifilum sp. TaxID=2760880 RepID=UPI0024AB88C8|nr:ATP-binding protein [Tenuifilum sp.]MDI3526448.1 serine/threonine-protein kinase RsbT [Tenuifilum sp.]
MKFEYKVQGGDFVRAGQASSQVKKVLKRLNVPPAIIKRVVVALYEGEVNIVAHAFQGKIYVDIDADKIKVVLDDIGPGIPDIDLAMKPGFSTASNIVREMGFGAGMGLPNIKENTDKMKISSVIDVGTRLEFEVNLK